MRSLVVRFRDRAAEPGTVIERLCIVVFFLAFVATGVLFLIGTTGVAVQPYVGILIGVAVLSAAALYASRLAGKLAVARRPDDNGDAGGD